MRRDESRLYKQQNNNLIMTKEEILAQLKEIVQVVRPSVNLNEVNFDTRLVEDLAMDSLSMMLTALAIENKLNVRFENNQIFKTVGEVCDVALQLMK